MNIKILKLLENNARMSPESIATALGMELCEVVSEISEMERVGVIRGYKGVIDWEKVDGAAVSAIIELKVVPKAQLGFEEVAEMISHYPEVESVSLMSGACDLIVTVKGTTFRDVSAFVAKELAVIDGVTSTATQFIMRRYKEFGVELTSTEDDGRGKISL
jgi:DNA-binding Lrp family transcriptional regulator